MKVHVIQLPYDSGRRGERMGRGPSRILEAGLMERLQMPTEVAVGQRTQVLQLVEQPTFRLCGQRGEDAQPRLLVQQPVEALVGETTVGGLLAISHRDAVPG